MRRSPFNLLACLCLYLWLGIGAAPLQAAPESILWAISDGPPYHIDPPGGPARSIETLGEGVTDRLIARLAEALPQFQHKVAHLSRLQLWGRMKRGDPVCYADAFLTPERLKVAYFSHVTVSVPLVLVARRGTLPLMPEGYALKEVLARADVRGAFEAQRSYGAALDVLIREAKAPMLPLPTTPQVLRMLEAGRMDFLVEYPMALQHYLEHLSPAPALEFHSLRDARDTPPAGVACTRTGWGLKVITAVDRAIRKLSARADAAEPLLRWLPEAVRREQLERIQRFYRERAGQSHIE